MTKYRILTYNEARFLSKKLLRQVDRGTVISQQDFYGINIELLLSDVLNTVIITEKNND